jgi:hypothetical protein
LAQAWLKGAILGVVVGMLVAWIPSPDNLGFILNLLPAAITAYAVYCYYNHKNASDQKQSKFTAMVVGCALAIIPILTSAGMSIGERSLRRQMMSNKVDYLSIDNIEKKYSEEGKVENKFDVLVKKYAGNDKNKVGLIKYLGFSYAVLADDLGVEGYESLQFALKCVTFHFPNEEQKIKKEVFDLYINTSEKKANWAHFESSLTARDIQNIKEEVSQMNPKSSCNHFKATLYLWLFL